MTAPRRVLIAPVRKVATVPQAPEEAFRLFTAEIGSWWPLATHSVGLDAATGVVFQPGAGGQIVEQMASGVTATWGTVTIWEPPGRVRFTWHPGTPEDEATEVEVTFTAAAAGTVVELVHTGWEHRPDGEGARQGYDSGWDVVLAPYVRRAT